MQWREFLEKSVPARLDQKVMVEGAFAPDHTAVTTMREVVGIEFDGENVIIVTETTK